jgi:hypothetical protein
LSRRTLLWHALALATLAGCVVDIRHRPEPCEDGGACLDGGSCGDATCVQDPESRDGSLPGDADAGALGDFDAGGAPLTHDGGPGNADAGRGNAALIGCSDGTREGLTDIVLFPDIAACGARWSMASLRVPRSSASAWCGGESDCASPADACSASWHVCGATGGSADLSTRISADQCRRLSTGEFVAALADVACDECGVGNGYGAVCCGESCVNQESSCVWPGETAWFGVVEGHVQACGDIELKWDVGAYGVMCCRD